MCVIVVQRKCPLAISKWRKVKTWKTLPTFLRFFHDASKNVKSSVLGDFEKRKNVFSNYDFYIAKRTLTETVLCWAKFLSTNGSFTMETYFSTRQHIYTESTIVEVSM